MCQNIIWIERNGSFIAFAGKVVSTQGQRGCAHHIVQQRRLWKILLKLLCGINHLLVQAALVQLGKMFYPQLWGVITGFGVVHVIAGFGEGQDRL